MFDLTARIGICAVVFLRTCIAVAGWRAVPNNAAQVVRLHTDEMIACRAFPSIEAGVVAKARQFILLRPSMRVLRQFFQGKGDGQEKNGIGGRPDDVYGKRRDTRQLQQCRCRQHRPSPIGTAQLAQARLKGLMPVAAEGECFPASSRPPPA
jgi:hypothetical protein